MSSQYGQLPRVHPTHLELSMENTLQKAQEVHMCPSLADELQDEDSAKTAWKYRVWITHQVLNIRIPVTFYIYSTCLPEPRATEK